jgi:internalin A
LKRLELDDSDISDAELPYLKGCHDLVYLAVTRTLIKGPGLSVLRNFPHLKSLFVGHNALDENMLSGLESLHEVTELHLDQAGIGDVALVHVGRMEALEDLRLGDNKKITDAGIVHLKGLRKLNNLDISGTSVTKQCVKTLAELPSLRFLRISSPTVTTLDLVEIEKQLKGCQIRGEKQGKVPLEMFAPMH